jgi:hypothetical protein
MPILIGGSHTQIGNLKFIADAKLSPSGHCSLSGVPRTAQILNIWSTSLLPGKRGRRVYVSAIIHPTAHRSIGEL